MKIVEIENGFRILKSSLTKSEEVLENLHPWRHVAWSGQQSES